MKDKWYNSDFASSLGIGVMIFLICCGLGTCSMLDKVKIEKTQESAEKIVDRILEENTK